MQACKHKHRKLHDADLRFFAPDTLRDAAPAGKSGAHEGAAYAKLEGLGKIPFSNIRRPRPLMDLMEKQPGEQDEASLALQAESLRLCCRCACGDIVRAPVCVCVYQQLLACLGRWLFQDPTSTGMREWSHALLVEDT